MSHESRSSHLKKTGQQRDLIAQQMGHMAEVRALEEEDYELALGNSRPPRMSLKVVIPLFVLLLLAIAIPLAMSLQSDGEGAVESPGAVERGGGDLEKLPEIDESLVTNLSEENVAHAFLEAGSWEERRRYVRDADEVSGHMRAYPEEVKAFPIPVAELRSMGAITPGGGVLRYERFAARMESGGMRFLCVVQTEQGPRVDYDSFARYATASGEEVQAGRPVSEVRLMAERDSYFNNRFQDETKWACFKLSCPDWPKTVWGYAPTGSITAELLSQIVSAQAQRVTLALRSEEDSHLQSQFVIERVVVNGWVRTPLDPEESLRRSTGK
jgi:hypothetical protein